MSESKRAVFLKQSGESLAQGGEDSNWTIEGIEAVVHELVEAHKAAKDLGISGITVIPGAGNVVRGREFPPEMELLSPDGAGRFGTVLNAYFLQEFLGRAGVLTETLLAHSIGVFDKHFKPAAFNVESVRQAHKEGKIVIIGGGTGEDGKTTDNAVVFYARNYKETYGGEVVILKSTKVDGVYQGDPATAKMNGDTEPVHYMKISGQEMLDDYNSFQVVDKGSLEQLVKYGLTMHIYQEGKHSLLDVLRHEKTGSPSEALGTLVVSEACEPVLYT